MNGCDAIADEFSVGPYVLFGGEIPAMVIMSRSRLIGCRAKASVQTKATQSKGSGYPQYTRRGVVCKSKIKIKNQKHCGFEVLLSGDHAKIKMA